jgi:hypothetical protein
MAERLIVELLDQDGTVHDQVFDFGAIVEILAETGRRVIVYDDANPDKRLEFCIPHVDVGRLQDGSFRLHEGNVGSAPAPDVDQIRPDGFFKRLSILGSQR